MAWDVLSGATKMAWDVLSGGDKNCMGCFVRGGKSMWDVLSRVSKNGMGCFVPGCFVLHSFLTHHFDDNIPISNYLKWILNLNQVQVILSKQVLERKVVWLKTEEVILAIGKKCSNINNVILINFKN